jgi:hypothetical protein
MLAAATGHRAPGAAGLVKERLASFAALDLLAVAGHDTRVLALKDGRTLLEERAADWATPLNLSPATPDFGTALEWSEDFPACREGLGDTVCQMQESPAVTDGGAFPLMVRAGSG